LDEAQVLWGTQVEATLADFCLVSDGQQGLVHAPPLALPVQQWASKADNLQRNLRLQVRHYLAEEPATGWLRIAFSRLVDLYAQSVTATTQPTTSAAAPAAQSDQTTGGGQ
jgi:CRISPR-associated protein (TIGR03984 family)